MPISVRPKPFLSPGCPGNIYAELASLSKGCSPDRGRLHTCYSPVRHSPAGGASSSPAAVRLACVKPAASVHPEPGSNSPLLNILLYLFSVFVCLRPVFRNFPESPSRYPSFVFPLSQFQISVTLRNRYAACLVASCHCSLSLATVFHALASISVPARFPDRGCKLTAFFLAAQVPTAFLPTFSSDMVLKSHSIKEINKC